MSQRQRDWGQRAPEKEGSGVMNPFRQAAEVPEDVRSLSPESFDRWCRMREKIAESETDRIRARGDGPYVVGGLLGAVLLITVGIVAGHAHAEIEDTKRTGIHLQTEQERTRQAEIARDREASYWAQVKAQASR